MIPDTFDVATAPQRNSKHWKQSRVTWDEILGWLDEPAAEKECGQYVLGTIERTRACPDCQRRDKTLCRTRSNESVSSRSALTLDVDTPDRGFMDAALAVWPYALAAHTTYSSAPDQPKYRLIIPLTRPVAPDEYVLACRVVMHMLGDEGFDHTTAQPARYMFKPSAQERDWYESWVVDGDAVDPDELLKGHFIEDYSDEPLLKPHRRKRDPFSLEGVVGAFNRAYEDFDELIAEYELPYDRVSEDRWSLRGARGAAGMGVVAEGLVYSHHANDPAYGRAQSAFDLVRLHRFSELDEGAKPNTPVVELPSHAAMQDLAMEDDRVKMQLAGLVAQDFADDVEDATWRANLSRSKRTGNVVDIVGNWDILVEHDPFLKSLRYNEMTFSYEATKDLPWRATALGGPEITTTDRQVFLWYLEREYGLKTTAAQANTAIDAAGKRDWHNPVLEYLNRLEWDGTPRLETSLPGTDDTLYNRLVARKVLVAAVARAYEPGVKWDHTLVLFGQEGIGKTYWIERMAHGWFAQLGAINDKDTLLTMQRSWIMTSDEAHTLRKADADQQKEFLTRTADVFRMPYDREAQVHPRRCVIWGTTNDEVFLRRQEGNRRFLIVRCERRLDFPRMTDEYVDQVWAEAVHLYRQGERLYLTHDETKLAQGERESHVEEDALMGIISEYVDSPVPPEWASMDRNGRIQWAKYRLPDPDTDTLRIDHVCTLQIWYEALGETRQPRKTDLLEIREALVRMGWTMVGKKRLPAYGPQATYQRPTGTGEQEEDYFSLI